MPNQLKHAQYPKPTPSTQARQDTECAGPDAVVSRGKNVEPILQAVKFGKPRTML
jgi:hypothetical protein